MEIKRRASLLGVNDPLVRVVQVVHGGIAATKARRTSLRLELTARCAGHERLELDRRQVVVQETLDAQTSRVGEGRRLPEAYKYGSSVIVTSGSTLMKVPRVGSW